MKKLYFLQVLSLGLYLGGTTCNIGLFLAASKILGVDLPAIFLIFSVLLILPISAIIRIVTFARRKTILTSDELNRVGPKIYFSTAIVELFVFLVGVGFALAS